MKHLLIILLIILSCNTPQKTPIKSTINNYLIKQSMGFITIKSISEPVKLTDSTYTLTHIFLNKIIEKDVRVTNIYTITADTVKTHHTTKTEVKEDGTWVVSPF